MRERVHNTDEASARAEEWPDPLPLPNGLPPVEPFPPEILPPTLAPWLTDVAERMQCPLDIPAAAVLVCLGSVIGRRCGIRPRRRDSWLVVPNLWGAVVGRPGLMKSPAIKEAMRPLRLLEKTATDEFKEEQQRRKIADDARELERRAAEQQALKGLRAGTASRESIENTLSRFVQDEQPVVRRRFITKPHRRKARRAFEGEPGRHPSAS